MAPELDIEQLLVWAFSSEKASIRASRYLDATAGYPQDSTIRVERVALMGGWIDGTGPGARWCASDTSEGAERVAAAVVALGQPMAGVVQHHARTRTRPDWRPYARHRWEPVEWEFDGATGEEWARAEIVPEDQLGARRVKRVEREWCPDARKTVAVPVPRWVRITQRDTPQQTERHREAYLDWWLALVDLHSELEGRVPEFTLSAHFPPQCPWNDLGR